MDGKTHHMELYTHVESGSCSSLSTVVCVDFFSQGSFFAADSVQNVTWSTASTFRSVLEAAQLQNQQLLTENAHGQAEWGQFYFATARVSFLSWKRLLFQARNILWTRTMPLLLALVLWTR